MLTCGCHPCNGGCSHCFQWNAWTGGRPDRQGIWIAGFMRVGSLHPTRMDGELEAVRSSDGETLFVDPMHGDRGSKGRFLVVYRTPEREGRYGWFCANCETVDNAMDAMGRIECNVCGNLRKPTDWDAAHE